MLHFRSFPHDSKPTLDSDWLRHTLQQPVVKLLKVKKKKKFYLYGAFLKPKIALHQDDNKKKFLSREKSQDS